MKRKKTIFPIILILFIFICRGISVAEDISLTKEVYKKSDGKELVIHLVKINPDKSQIYIYYGNNEGLTIEDLIEKEEGIEAAINCGFFQDPFLPVGLLISGEKKITPLDSYWDHTGIFYITKDPYDPYGICTKDIFYDTDVMEAVQSFPILVWNSEPYVQYKDTKNAARSAIGIDEEGNIVLIATNYGITLYEFSRLLSRWNYKRALNLDGGSSTQLYFKDRLIFYGSTGIFKDNRVSNFLVVKKK